MTEFVDTKEYAEGARSYAFKIALRLNPYRPEYDAARYMAWRAGWIAMFGKATEPMPVPTIWFDELKGERNES